MSLNSSTISTSTNKEGTVKNTYDVFNNKTSVTDTKDYHYDQWYDYSEPLNVVGDKKVEDTFKNLKEQAKKKQTNGNVCTSELSDKYDVTYFKEAKETQYTLDRNKEYTQVLKSNDTINVYGDTLLQSNNESIITAKNESVVAKVTNTDIKKISYSDWNIFAINSEKH